MINNLNELSIDLFSLKFLKDINEVINLSMINKNLNELFDNKIYCEWGINKYSNDFWKKAFKRPMIISNPLPSMKLELIRIFKFQENLKKNNLPEWNKEEFYLYWDTLEDIFYKKIQLNKHLLNPSPSITSIHNI